MAPLAMSPRPMSPGGTIRPLSPSMFPMMQHPMMAPGGAAGACARDCACDWGTARVHSQAYEGISLRTCPCVSSLPPLTIFVCPSCRCNPGVGITFEPDLTYGSATHGMHVITKIRPDSPAHKSKNVFWHSGRGSVVQVKSRNCRSEVNPMS